MNKILIFTLFLISSTFAVEIPTQHVQLRSFGKSVELNSKIIQLSNAKQSVMSLLNGRIEKYYVKPGEKIVSGQKIALIESITLSQMTAEYIGLKKKLVSFNKNYMSTKKLYNKGIVSSLELNNQNIQKNEIMSRISTLTSQLKTLGINTNTLKKATSYYTLFAYSKGVVSTLLQPLHNIIDADSAIISIIKEEAYYVKSYLPLEYSDMIKVGQKLVINYKNKNIVTKVTQILPELDEETQRIILLSSINPGNKKLYINAYVPSKLYFDTNKKYLSIKKSALSFFNNEWVVFVPKEEEKGHEEEKDQEEEKDHEEEKDQYKERVIKIITEDDNYIAIKGLESGEEYVSDKSFYVKSLILKSSMGDGHGH